MDEEWKAIPGYEGLYEASTLGRIRSTRWWPHKIMKFKETRKMGRGKVCSLQLNLYLRGDRRTHIVSHLILFTFVGPRPPNLVACHWDGSVYNNAVPNLRWDTNEANMIDRERHGTSAVGVRNPNAKLAEKDVFYIRTSTERTASLSAQFGVSMESIQNVRRRVTWKHLP